MFTFEEFINALSRMYETETLPSRLIAVYAGHGIGDVDFQKCPYADISLEDFQDNRKKVRKAFYDYIGTSDKSDLAKDLKKAFNDGDDSEPKSGWGGGWSRKKDKKKRGSKDEIKPKKCLITRFQLSPTADILDDRTDARKNEPCLLVVMADGFDD